MLALFFDHIRSGHGKDFGFFTVRGLVHPGDRERDVHETDGAGFLLDPIGATTPVTLGVSNPTG